MRADAPLAIRQLRGAGKGGNLDDLALGAVEDVEKAAASGVEDFAAVGAHNALAGARGGGAPPPRPPLGAVDAEGRLLAAG